MARFRPAAASAQSAEFRRASITDPQTMDPHAVNSSPVLFSWRCAAIPDSGTASGFAPVAEMHAPDAYTIEMPTTAPNPIFPDSIANWPIMDSGWAAANEAGTPAKKTET